MAETPNQAELEAFVGWMKKGQFLPFAKAIGTGINLSNYRRRPEYSSWVNKGSPGYTHATAEARGKAEAYQEFMKQPGATHQRWLDYIAGQYGETPSETTQPPALPMLPEEPGEWSFSRMEIVGDFYVPVYSRRNPALGKYEYKTVWTERTPIPGTETGGMSEAERMEQEFEYKKQLAELEGGISAEEQASLDYQEKQLLQQQTQFGLEQKLLRDQMAQQARLQQEMLSWYREQAMMEQEAERERQLANLRANPASWLEYASLAGETPAIQPWMLPLAPEQYGMQAGQPIPGWTAQEESLSTMPELKTPSTQYTARMSPSARQQYGGYEQARTGATPADVEWRLWSEAPPGGGGSRGLSHII